jgi:hypothetical protein
MKYKNKINTDTDDLKYLISNIDKVFNGKADVRTLTVKDAVERILDIAIEKIDNDPLIVSACQLRSCAINGFPNRKNAKEKWKFIKEELQRVIKIWEGIELWEQ